MVFPCLSSLTRCHTPKIPHRLDEAKRWTVLLTGIEFKSKLGWITQGHSRIISEVTPALSGLVLCRNRSSNIPLRWLHFHQMNKRCVMFCCSLGKSFLGDLWTQKALVYVFVSTVLGSAQLCWAIPEHEAPKNVFLNSSKHYHYCDTWQLVNRSSYKYSRKLSTSITDSIWSSACLNKGWPCLGFKAESGSLMICGRREGCLIFPELQRVSAPLWCSS